MLDEEEEEATVLKFVNHVLREALEQKATDIHLEPLEVRFRFRIRVDGELREIPAPANVKAIQSSLVSRLKIMARLDIAERRLPQDGRMHLRVAGRGIDTRVATIPSVEGETVCLRLLGQETFTLDALGLRDDLRRSVDELLRDPNGIVLLTGPTGSGKSTSLYAFLGGDQRHLAQDRHGGGSGGTQDARHRPAGCQTGDRSHLRARPAKHPARRSGRHHDRGNARSRDHGDRHPGGPHRPLGFQHAAHE